MAGTGPARRLPPRWRKLLLLVHVTASVGLLGTDAAVLLLAVTGARGADPAVVYPAARMVGTDLLLPLALAALVTGIAQGLLTPWGLLRHWWVALKLALTVAGSVLALLVLIPALSELATAATSGGSIPLAARLFLVRDTAAASVVLLIAVTLSVYKPFGRLRRETPGRSSVTSSAVRR